jgi:hypothetical protein
MVINRLNVRVKLNKTKGENMFLFIQAIHERIQQNIKANVKSPFYIAPPIS